jgi:chromosome segregation ATPase
MANPWLRALRALPWAALLTKAPELARAADTMLSGTRSRQSTSAAVDQLRNLTDRIEALENRDRAAAELLKQITDQVSALTTATEVLAARQRWLMAIGILALGLAILAVVLAF